MDARPLWAALLAALLVVSMGARVRTPNFIIETPNAQLAQQFAKVAEDNRRDLAVAWLGKPMPNWSQPCVVTVNVGPNLGAGGATDFVFANGEVFGWRMTIQGPAERIVDSVLPHEITHMIFASHFRQPLPRWADEGGATSVEHPSERMKQRTMLVQLLRSGNGIAFDRMFAMMDYPHDFRPLYAQGYSLAEFLIQQGGRRAYVAFLDDGLKTDDWSGAIRRHYDIGGTGALQNTWLAWVRQGSPNLRPRPQQPAAPPDDTLLAAADRRPRPEPNLLYHIAKEDPPAYAPGSVIAAQAIAPVQTTNATTQATAPAEPVARQLASVELPATGWHAAGTPARSPSTASPEPVRSQLSRPQPIQRIDVAGPSQPAEWR